MDFGIHGGPGTHPLGYWRTINRIRFFICKMGVTKVTAYFCCFKHCVWHTVAVISHIVMSWTVFLQNSYDEFLTPVPQNATLSGDRAFTKVSKFKRRALIQCHWCPLEREIWAQTCRQGEHQVQMRAMTEVMLLSAGISRLPATHQRLEEQTFRRALRRNQPCWRLDLGLHASRNVRQ